MYVKQMVVGPSDLILMGFGDRISVKMFKIEENLRNRIPMQTNYTDAKSWEQSLMDTYFLKMGCFAKSDDFPIAKRHFYLGKMSKFNRYSRVKIFSTDGPVVAGLTKMFGLVGEEVRLTCDVRGVWQQLNKENFDWVKVEEARTTTSSLYSQQKSDPKYQFEFESVRLGFLAHLRIRVVSGEDFGLYRCLYMQRKDNKLLYQHTISLQEKGTFVSKIFSIVVVLCVSVSVILLLLIFNQVCTGIFSLKRWATICTIKNQHHTKNDRNVMPGKVPTTVQQVSHKRVNGATSSLFLWVNDSLLRETTDKTSHLRDPHNFFSLDQIDSDSGINLISFSKLNPGSHLLRLPSLDNVATTSGSFLDLRHLTRESSEEAASFQL
ncbi:hypothetical protein Ciccas_003012 [Cichlidogyrus casuarinus]|uniref:Ig-like domain-containing protein n=1 Tax=Cichlidogyrus casuarinus TaxID=1844966 RepID=A0ABD2QFP6_9PLAT